MIYFSYQNFKAELEKGRIRKRKKEKKKPKNSSKINSPHKSHKETPDEEVLRKMALHVLSSVTRQSSSDLNISEIYLAGVST